MAEGGDKDLAVGIFKKVLPRLSAPLGKKANFTNVTNLLFAEDLIAKPVLDEIKSKPTGNDRGSELAHALLDKIKASDDPVQCLLKICTVLEDDLVDDDELKKYGVNMRSQPSLATANTTSSTTSSTHSTAPVTTKATATISATTTSNHIIDPADANKVVKVLREAMFNATKWHDLGLDLGLYITTLSVIDADKGDSNSYLKKCIQMWLEKADKVDENGGPTWKSLIRAVSNTGDRAAAEKIPAKLASLYNIHL